LISRPHLLERLNYGLDRKFTLISAPAGYGKTTLLCQWLKDCPRTCTWLTLDEGDNDLAVLLSYLIAAVRIVFPNACPTTWELLRAPDTPPVDYLSTIFINELAEIPEPLILALGDYHTIRSRGVHELLDKVLQYLPEQIHLAIASRIEPPLALVRLRAARQVVELRADDLSFSVDEAGAYLELELGQGLPPEEEILRLISHGLTNQEIADQLVISPHTVKTHATNIYRKLAVDSRRHAIRKARRLGILPSN
jgi:LuxR family maltose regulon positive regulatory protein